MKIKKLACFIMMAVLMLVMTTPVFAASKSTRIQAKCTIPKVLIQVVVPTNAQIYINPRRLPIRVLGNIDTELRDPIVMDQTYLENQSEVPVKVSASVYGRVNSGSNMKLASSSTSSSGTEKEAFVYFEIVSASNPDAPSWSGSYDSDKHIVVSSDTVTKEDLITLGAAGKKNCYGPFRLSGDCTTQPEKPWTERDGLSVNISFTFTALPTDAITD